MRGTSSTIRSLLGCCTPNTALASSCSALLLQEAQISIPYRISSPSTPELPPRNSSLVSRSFSNNVSLNLHFSNPSLQSSHRSFSSSADESRVIEITSKHEFESTMQDIQDKSLSAVFYFTAVWCGPCRAIAPIIEELSKKYPHVTIYKVDIDKEDLNRTLSKLHVAAVPTFHFYHGGEKTASVVGADVTQLKHNMDAL